MGVYHSLVNADGSTNLVNCGSAANISALAQGTVMAWARCDDTGNNARNLFGGMGYEAFKRAVAGTEFRLSISRATTAQTVTTPTGGLVAGEIAFWAMAWNTAAGAAGARILKGSLRTEATDVGATVVEGAGAVSGATFMRLLGGAGASSGWPGALWTLGVWSRVDLALDEIHDQQWHPRPTRGCVAFWRAGDHGRGRVWDLTGYGNAGTIIGVRPLSETLPGVL